MYIRPLITDEDTKTLKTAFDKCIPVIQQKKVEKPHWRILKTMTKEERKQFQQSNITVKYVSKFALVRRLYSFSFVFRKDYAFGVNEVTKSLEKSTLCAALIASDVTPRLLVKHVIDICVIKNVPVLVVPQLRQLLVEHTGLSAVVFGLKSDDLLLQTVKNVFVNYPVPEDHMHYSRMQKCQKETNEIANIDDVTMTAVDNGDEATSEKLVYLYRTSNRERVFKPDLSKSSAKDAAISVPRDAGFLSLEENVEKTTLRPNYKALVVKRLKGNKDREKRKREIVRSRKQKKLL